MVDVRTDDPPDPLLDQDDIKDGTGQNTISNGRIAHTTTATVVNNRFTT